MSQKRILFLNFEYVPGQRTQEEHLHYVPYLPALLRGAAEQGGHTDFAWTILTHPLQPLAEQALTEPYDLVLVTAYVWSWLESYRYLSEYKSRWPAVLVVAGGPNLSWSDPQIFVEHPHLDLIVKGEGETILPQILTQFKGAADYRSIPSLIINSQGIREETPGVAKTPFENSWVSQTPIYSDRWLGNWLKEFRSLEHPLRGPLSAVVETTRGCPYSCAFCDWGSATNSRFRQFSLARVLAELKWIAQNKIEKVFICDSNFGFFPRDLEIARYLVELHQTYGYPKMVMHDNAKNHPERVFEILKTFKESGLYHRSRNLKVSLQTMTPQALDFSQRRNINTEQLVELVRKIQQSGWTVSAEMIAGCVGETSETWLATLSQLMELGIHDAVRVNFWEQLPNAPSAQVSYKVQHGLVEVSKRGTTYYGKGHIVSQSQSRTKIIQQTRYSDLSDQIRLHTMSAVVQAFHYMGLSLKLALYQRHRHGRSFLAMYRSLFSGLEATGILDLIKAHLKRYLTDPESDFVMPITSDWRVEPFEWLFIQALTAQVTSVSEVLAQTFLTGTDELEEQDLWAFQQWLWIRPEQANTQDYRGHFAFNWPRYFKLLTQDPPLAQPTTVAVSGDDLKRGGKSSLQPSSLAAFSQSLSSHEEFKRGIYKEVVCERP